jgi:hypothetical protein
MSIFDCPDCNRSKHGGNGQLYDGSGCACPCHQASPEKCPQCGGDIDEALALCSRCRRLVMDTPTER